MNSFNSEVSAEQMTITKRKILHEKELSEETTTENEPTQQLDQSDESVSDEITKKINQTMKGECPLIWACIDIPLLLVGASTCGLCNVL
jgi:hypothetical protein